jgi:hypothetical protein
MRNLAIIGLTLCLGGCATIVRGSDETVQMNSEPPGAQVRTDLGLSCPATPCEIKVPRKSEFTATFVKEGFKDQRQFVATKFGGGGAAGLAGNVLVGGIVGVGVDAATGATMDHSPNPVFVKMEAIAPEAPKVGKLPRAGKKRPVAIRERGGDA